MELKLPSAPVGAAIGLLVVFFIYRYISTAITNRRHARQALKLGCEEPPLAPTRGFFAFRDLIDSAKALAEKRMPELLLELQTHMYELKGYYVGAIKLNMPFATVIFTTEPANIKEMLALQFKDFELGPNRRGNFNPLLGNGIVSSESRESTMRFVLTDCSSLLMASSGSTRAACYVPSSRAPRSATSTWRKSTCRSS